MTIQDWILQQREEIQMAFWQQVSHLLSDMELNYVMSGVRTGKDLMTLHLELDVFNKYQVDMLKVLEIIRKKYPDEVMF